MAGKAPASKNVLKVSVGGVEYEVDKRALEDVRFVRLASEVQKEGDGSLTALVELFDFLLGDQVAKAEKALADSDGYVSTEAFSKLCAEIISEVGAKNSSGSQGA